MRALLAVALCAALPALAARPLATDDADTLPDKACQVEAWIDHSRAETQAWLVPACNFGGGIEWQFGSARRNADGASRFSESYVQAKSAWRVAPQWSVGAVAGITRHPSHAPAHGWDNPFVILPMSLWLEDGALAVHANVGWWRDRAIAREVATWGLAVERMFEHVTLLGEIYGENGRTPFVRLGGRYPAIAKRLDLDLSIVTRPRGDHRSQRFVSVGFLYQTGSLIP